MYKIWKDNKIYLKSSYKVIYYAYYCFVLIIYMAIWWLSKGKLTEHFNFYRLGEGEMIVRNCVENDCVYK